MPKKYRSYDERITGKFEGGGELPFHKKIRTPRDCKTSRPRLLPITLLQLSEVKQDNKILLFVFFKVSCVLHGAFFVAFLSDNLSYRKQTLGFGWRCAAGRAPPPFLRRSTSGNAAQGLHRFTAASRPCASPSVVLVRRAAARAPVPPRPSPCCASYVPPVAIVASGDAYAKYDPLADDQKTGNDDAGKPPRNDTGGERPSRPCPPCAGACRDDK